jgi:BASS family bile acid:Na+ symporter
MTAVSNLLAIVLMPLNFAFWGSLHPTGHQLMQTLQLKPSEMLIEVGLVIGIPFIIGLSLRQAFPRVAERAGKVISPVAFLALGALILIALLNNWRLFLDYIGIVVIAVFLHDALALGLGYTIGRVTRLPDRSTRAMTFEVGIRNAGLGLLLVFTSFKGLGGMALVAAWWGIWDIIAALTVARLWRRRAPRDARLEASPVAG